MPRLILAMLLLALPNSGWCEVQRDVTRFHTSVERANTALANGRLFWGKFWLRQAYQTATGAPAKSDVERVLRRVSLATPLDVRLSFSLSPPDNVNDGSETDFIWIGGFPFELDVENRKLPRIRSDASVNIAYRLSESSNSKDELLSDVFFRNVWIDGQSAIVEAPDDVKGADFNVTSVGLGYRKTVLVFPEVGITEMTVLVGQT